MRLNFEANRKVKNKMKLSFESKTNVKDRRTKRFADSRELRASNQLSFDDLGITENQMPESMEKEEAVKAFKAWLKSGKSVFDDDDEESGMLRAALGIPF